MSDARGIIEAWVSGGGRPQSDLELRLVRRISGLAETLGDRIKDPIDRALAGLDSPPEMVGSLRQRVRIAVAGGGDSKDALGALEDEARAGSEPSLWVMAARCHAAANLGREAAARMSLSNQSLPYVFPGEIDPMMVDLLAVGERVLPALHVDWVRKLTTWVAPALAPDCHAMGLWFWPVLAALDANKLSRPLKRVAESPMAPGGRGLAVVYGQRIGIDMSASVQSLGDIDKRIVALARLGDDSG